MLRPASLCARGQGAGSRCSSGTLRAGEASTSQLSAPPFTLPPAFIWMKGCKTAGGPGGREGYPGVCVCPCPGPASIQAELGSGGAQLPGGWGAVVATLEGIKSLPCLESWQSSEKQSDRLPLFFLVDLVFHLKFTFCFPGLRESPDSALCLVVGQGTWSFPGTATHAKF